MPFTKWYNIHERHSISEFKAEGVILAITIIVIFFHLLGSSSNRTKAKKWMKANANTLTSEFALVGFGRGPTADTDAMQPEKLLKEKSLFEYATYATGRQNVAFMDVKITLNKRFNPILNNAEKLFSFFIEAFGAPEDVLEAFLYPFDGKEDKTVPGAAEARGKEAKSTYDGFVWAIVHKDRMQKLRDDRYDVSITATKDSNKLPVWLSIMSENAEITDTLLTDELIDVVTAAGDDFEYLIISDQPTVKPAAMEELTNSKRLFLKHRLPSNNDYAGLAPLFAYFIRLPDLLVEKAHFRPEVTKKVKAVRESLASQLQKKLDEEKSEDRAIEKEKAKKAKRDAELAGLDAKAQKRYLEKEQERLFKKSQKKTTARA